MITLRLLTTSDVDDLHPRLRVEDQEECVVLGSNPRDCLLMGAFDNVFTVSKGRAYALLDDAKLVIGAIGFTSSGFLWALSTKFTQSQRRELFWRTGEILERLLKEAKQRKALCGEEAILHNIIHSRNRVSIKWLERTGLFHIDRERPIEVGAELFYPFRTLTPHELKAPRLGGAIITKVDPVCAPLYS